MPEVTPCRDTLLTPLQAMAAQRPPHLIGDAAWARILGLAARLPETASGFFGFECPLGGDTERVDFLFCSTRDEGHTRVLAGTNAPDGDAHAAWACVHALCAAWNAQPSSLDGLHNLWLEFDVGSRAESAGGLTPSLFFGLSPDLAGQPTEALLLARHALALVAPAASHGPRGALLERLFAALPATAHVFQVGAMLGRDAPAIRVCVRDIDVAGVDELLGELAWCGDREALRTLLAALAARVARIDLDLDIGETVGPRIGLECYPGSDEAVATRLAALTDWLVAHDLCRAAQAADLRQYQGLTHPRTVDAPWPASWAAIARARGATFESCLCRWVHHVKIVFEAGAPRAAKAYLAVEHVPLDRRQLARAIAARRHALAP